MAYDECPEEKLSKETLAALSECGAKRIKDFEALKDEKDLICIISPGVPVSAKRFDAVRKFPFISETQFGWEGIKGKTIALTGTNGKSTTVALMEHLLKNEGAQAIACGNFGIPLSEIVLDRKFDNYVKVLELSSFQLEHMEGVEPDVSICLDITENHLNRYASFKDYREAKLRLFRKNSFKAHWIIHERVLAGEKDLAGYGKLTSFCGGSTRGEVKIEIQDQGVRGALEASFDFSSHFLGKPHNRENCAVALVAVYLLLGKVPQAARGLAEYKNLHFRQEPVEVDSEILVINDSKSTSPDSALKAIEVYNEPMILIMGGRNKDSTFAEFVKQIETRPVKVVVYGESGPFFDKIFTGRVPFKREERLEEAVSTAFQWIEGEKLILFSPACESFDQFNGYVDRGECFNKYVTQYAKQRGGKK